MVGASPVATAELKPKSLASSSALPWSSRDFMAKIRSNTVREAPSSALVAFTALAVTMGATAWATAIRVTMNSAA